MRRQRWKSQSIGVGRHHHVIGEAGALAEDDAAGPLGACRVRRVVEEDTAGIEMVLYQREEFGGEQVGDVGAEIPGRVRDDGVKVALGIEVAASAVRRR